MEVKFFIIFEYITEKDDRADVDNLTNDTQHNTHVGAGQLSDYGRLRPPIEI